MLLALSKPRHALEAHLGARPRCRGAGAKPAFTSSTYCDMPGTERAGLGPRLGVLDDAEHLHRRLDEDHVERDERVAHPERRAAAAARTGTACPRPRSRCMRYIRPRLRSCRCTRDLDPHASPDRAPAGSSTTRADGAAARATARAPRSPAGAAGLRCPRRLPAAADEQQRSEHAVRSACSGVAITEAAHAESRRQRGASPTARQHRRPAARARRARRAARAGVHAGIARAPAPCA